MSFGHNHDPPPAYKYAIRSTIYTIPASPAENPVPHNEGQSHPPPPPLSETRGNQIRDYLIMPPSYDELFGLSPGRQTPLSADSPEHASTNTSEQRSTQPATSTTEPIPQTPQQTTSTTSETDEEKAKRKATLVKTFVIIPTMIVTLAVCISMLYIGTTYACEAAQDLNGYMLVSGGVGIAGCVYYIYVLWQHHNGRERRFRWLTVIIPLTLICSFVAGSSEAYRVWREKPCHPLEMGGCAGYCDNELMMFSFIFYISSTILLSPLWILILYVVFGSLFKCMRKLCKEMKTQ